MINKKEINIMLGGQFPKEIDKDVLWCGVDKGALYLVNYGIKPVLSCGDFDSVSKEDKEKVREMSEQFLEKESQYLTDADFALEEIIKLFPKLNVINIYGATGRRLDHFFGNILLLNNERYNGIELNIIDENNIITVSKVGKSEFQPKEGYKYFSVVPIYPQTKMTIKNAKYEALNLILTQNRPNATSNEFDKDKVIELEVDKDVLVIYSKD